MLPWYTNGDIESKVISLSLNVHQFVVVDIEVLTSYLKRIILNIHNTALSSFLSHNHCWNIELTFCSNGFQSKYLDYNECMRHTSRKPLPCKLPTFRTINSHNSVRVNSIAHFLNEHRVLICDVWLLFQFNSINAMGDGVLLTNRYSLLIVHRRCG